MLPVLLHILDGYIYDPEEDIVGFNLMKMAYTAMTINNWLNNKKRYLYKLSWAQDSDGAVILYVHILYVTDIMYVTDIT